MSERSFLEDHRWELCKAFLERADKSAEILRALLFAAGGAGIGFSLHERTDGGSRYHVLAAALFAVAVGVVYWSWDLQKRKARERFLTVRDKGIAAYVARDTNIKSNRRLDCGAAILLALAVILEGWLAY